MADWSPRQQPQGVVAADSWRTRMATEDSSTRLATGNWIVDL